MLIGGLVAVVVVLGVVAVVLMARRTHDDEHSVEHYHRQLHTLEEIRTHPTGDGADGRDSDAGAFPASAFRVSGSSTVRLTESARPPVPPVPPPPVPNPSEPLSFDDSGPEPVPATFMTGNEDRVIQSINHRPRRLGGPLAAVAAGCDGLFLETHPRPDEAKSDGPNMVPLDALPDLIRTCQRLRDALVDVAPRAHPHEPPR